ncbi:hypothetical protein Tco_0202049 [Tanacetum coccineum]
MFKLLSDSLPLGFKICFLLFKTVLMREAESVCANDELQTKKIIKFRLGGRAHSLTLLEFARRLGLYQATELDEDGFNVYFEGGLRSDEHFNAQEYWLSISREENLSLSRSHASTIRYPILRVVHKMITYGLCQRTTGYDKIQKNDLWLLSMFDARHQNGYANVAWLIARWMKRKGAGTQKESQICCGQFITKLARKSRVLTDDVIRSLSAPIYYRDLDTTTLRELIDSEGRLIPEDPQSGVPRIGIPRPPRASMQDLYDRMGHMEIRQEAIERMEYRQSYHWDMYQRVFEHMARVYSVPLQGAYNPPVYAQPYTTNSVRYRYGTGTVLIPKPEIKTISIDDLYHNFKIVEQKIKKIVRTSSGGQNLAFMTAPNSSSTNDANTAYSQVSAASPSVNTASHKFLAQQVSVIILCMLLWLKIQMVYMSTSEVGKQIHKMIWKQWIEVATLFGVRAPRSKEDQFRNQDNTRKQGNNEDTSKAMLAIDGVGFDLDVTGSKNKFQANMALLGYYSRLPPPHPLIYNRPNKLDLSYSGLNELKEPKFKGYGPENSLESVNCARSYRTPFNTVRPKVITTARQNRTSVNAARANGFNAGPQHVGESQFPIILLFVQASHNMIDKGDLLIVVGDEVIHKELGDRMERAATTASSLEARAG